MLINSSFQHASIARDNEIIASYSYSLDREEEA